MKALQFQEPELNLEWMHFGLVPGGGDIVSGVFSLYMLRAAIKMNLPKRAVFSMFLNIILDTT